MSGVWVFRNGVARPAENPAGAASDTARGKKEKKSLLHTPSGEAITSYAALERRLAVAALGWERYHGGGDSFRVVDA